MKRRRLNETESRWKILDERLDCITEIKKSRKENDPFDCSSLIASDEQLVEKVSTQSVQSWQELESRRVFSKVRTGWSAVKARLPLNFDYLGLQPEPPSTECSSDNEDGSGGRVIDLENPSVHLSYESQLWKLFKAVPTLKQMQKGIYNGQTEEQRFLFHHTEQCVKTIQTKLNDRKREEGTIRLRMSDCHHEPDAIPKLGSDQQQKISTVRLEMWRRQLSRSALPSSFRAVAEFSSEQTLQQVHSTIEELTDDGLWTQSEGTEEESPTSCDAFFFIENTFYLLNTTDNAHVKHLLDWLSPNRRKYLGLSQGEIKTKLMADTRLRDLPWRLNTRYVHIYHGSIETALFFADTRILTLPLSAREAMPIIHDRWTPSTPLATCHVCNRLPPVFVVNAIETDGGPTFLCRICFKELTTENTNVQATELPKMEYNVWRNEGDISSARNGGLEF